MIIIKYIHRKRISLKIKIDIPMYVQNTTEYYNIIIKNIRIFI